MSIPNDPVMLLSFINTNLRDHYDSLDELCLSLSLPKNDIVAKLSMIDYEYDANRNQFL
ncbi:MAG: DUF4250 domain-containing protein [Lachnospiraceae bacterium]|nr:DUF4250 domain-containing protein [Lachnospiraceae bacterium]